VRRSHLSHLLGDGVQALVLGLGVGEDVARLAELGLQLQDPLLVVGLLTGRLLDETLLAALPVRRHLPVVGVGLSEGLEAQSKQENKSLLRHFGRIRVGFPANTTQLKYVHLCKSGEEEELELYFVL